MIKKKTWKYTKHHTEETKRKISEANKGRKLTKKHKRKISKAMMGNLRVLGKHWTVSGEGRKNMSKSAKLSWKEGTQKGRTGQHWKASEESKKKISDAHKRGCYKGISKMLWKKGKITGMRGKHHNKKTKRKLSKISKGRISSDDTRRKMSKSMKILWKNKEYRHKVTNASHYFNGHKVNIKIRKRISKGFKRHQKAILEEMENYRKHGFEVVNTDKIRPDFIARKDGKFYAVEVEFGMPSTTKYNNIKVFDDIIWIIRKSAIR